MGPNCTLFEVLGPSSRKSPLSANRVGRPALLVKGAFVLRPHGPQSMWNDKQFGSTYGFWNAALPTFWVHAAQ